MQRDIRDTALYRKIEALARALRQPGTGQISDAAEIHASPDGREVVFTGAILDKLEGVPLTRICVTTLETGDTRVVTFGPNTDRLPRFSPDGRRVAFLSDRHAPGDFQLYLLDLSTGAAQATAPVEGWVEYLHWSPDGKRILLGVAGHGADVSGGQGAVTSKQAASKLPSWMPTVESGSEDYRWRSAWVFEAQTNRVRRVSPTDVNVWEATWCGNDTLAAIESPGPGEGLWYTAKLALIDTGSSHCREIYTPRDQLGWSAGSPSGKYLAIVEAVCSDRWIVAGSLSVIQTDSGKSTPVDTHGVDVTYTEWRSEEDLLVAGHRGFETVIGCWSPTTRRFTEDWVSAEVTTGGRYVSVAGIGDAGDCALIGENFTRAPEIAIIRSGEYRTVRTFDCRYAELARAIAAVERITWRAPDGLEIEGWLLRPQGPSPHPLVMEVHGGPVWHWRPRWLGRSALHTLALVERGYAAFFPNPRGSAGRGQAFVRGVLGDMGGADTYDYLSGLDHLVSQKLADPRRLGVTGGSYGGFMTSWLITQDTRFAAAVPVAPVSNQVTEHLVSNIPHFVSLFLADHYTKPGGKYFERSPIMHAHKTKTPTLNVCGALDRCTPPEEAMQFHNALLENKVESVLVTYPEEGHGIRKLPAAIDFAVRMVEWFERHMKAG